MESDDAAIRNIVWWTNNLALRPATSQLTHASTNRRLWSRASALFYVRSDKFWGVLLTYAQGRKGAMCASILSEHVRGLSVVTCA